MQATSNYKRQTALMFASSKGMASVVEKLLVAGADPDLRNVRPIHPFAFQPLDNIEETYDHHPLLSSVVCVVLPHNGKVGPHQHN
jgi:ankyrin repeat protein